MDLWRELNGIEHLLSLSTRAFRMVECQEEVATTVITRNHEEQALLEELLEEIKPIQEITLANRHYLIKTPFRYPPLKHGSRFATRFEPSLFYASDSINTVLHEVAFYRFLFLQDMAEPEKLTQHNPQSNHTTFYVHLYSENAIDLTLSPFNEYRDLISSENSYAVSQQIGGQMREAKIELFSFWSARYKSGKNYAAISHQAIKSKLPKAPTHWQCLTQANRVVFNNWEQKQSIQINRESFNFK